MTYKLSTTFIPLVHVGMYDSPLSADNALREYDDDRNEKPFDYDHFDYPKYRATVGKLAAICAEDAAKEYLVGKGYGIKAVTSNGEVIPPPRGEYNFETDELALDVEVEDNFLETALANVKKWNGNQKIDDWLTDHFRSYPGFSSACPESLEDLAAALRLHAIAVDAGDDYKNGFLTRAVGEYISLCLADSGYFDSDEDTPSEYANTNEELLNKISEYHSREDFIAG